MDDHLWWRDPVFLSTIENEEYRHYLNIFTPNVTPHAMFDLGVYSGSYFRPIKSDVTNKTYKRRYLRYGLRAGPKVNRKGPVFLDSANYFGIHSGTTKEFWEENGWITHYHPYGWIEWYCDFHRGNFHVEEENIRQIKRWYSFVKRHSSAKYVNNKWVFPRPLSDKVKQALLNWAVLYE